jgi:hypothetical protein
LDEAPFVAGPALHTDRSFASFYLIDSVRAKLCVQSTERPSSGVEHPDAPPAIDDNQEILSPAVAGGGDFQDVFGLPQYVVHIMLIGRSVVLF